MLKESTRRYFLFVDGRLVRIFYSRVTLEAYFKNNGFNEKEMEVEEMTIYNVTKGETENDK